MKISDFLDNDFRDYSAYDTFRSICSIVDGLKPSARKIIYTLQKSNDVKPNKVVNLASQTAIFCNYLHGNTSLEGVIVGLAQNFPGSNNINLLYPDGSFGDRLVQEAAASRYIYTRKEKWFDSIFLKEDNPVLIEQEFEGDLIEPKFLVPIIPLAFVNGSEGIGTGFAQKVLPRNIKEIIKYIKTKKANLIPYYEGFNGKIESFEGSFLIKGSFERTSRTSITITEIPIGYDLAKYISILDKLEEQKVISSYQDKSENGKFKFEIKATSEFIKKEDEYILDKLKLVKRVSENLTFINDQNQIIEFDNIEESLNYYISIREMFYIKRKKHQLTEMKYNLDILKNRYKFVYFIIKGEIVINKKTKEEITLQCEAKQLLKKDDSFDYLIQMPIYSLSANKLKELQEQIETKTKEIEELEKTTEIEMWISDIKNFEKKEK